MENKNIDAASLMAMFGDSGYITMDNGDINATLSDKEPNDWKDLQVLVYKLFSQLGYVSELEKKIQSVRSTIEIDVYAERRVYGYDSEKIIVECKNWKNNIPQEVVHSVRTVAEDIGANKAYIIAKTGFQKGAKNAINNTVVKLFTLKEFINSITEEWVSQFKVEYYKELRKLKKYLYLNEMLCWKVGSSQGFRKKEHYELFLIISNTYNFLFFHLRLLEQDIKMQLEDNPEQYERFQCNLSSLLSSAPKDLKIKDKIYPLNCGMDLFDLIYKGRIVDELDSAIETFLKMINKTC